MKPQKDWRRWAVIAAAILLALVVIDYWMYPLWGQQGPTPRRRYQSGIWLRYTWYFGEKSDADIRRLAATLTQHRMRDAYFHVRYVKPDGTLKFRFPDKARNLNNRLKQLAPAVRSIAWIYAGHGKLGDVDLSKAEVRQKMAEEAAWLVKVGGFDGVQWDYEICPDGDLHFLDLLERTRLQLPKGAFLGVAAPMWFPIKSVGWTPSYFTTVAHRADQLAIMCYDSGFYTPRAYCWLVERQLRVLPEAVAKGNRHCQLLLGLPTYEEGPFSHNSRAENLEVALWGVRKGLAAAGADSMTGVALFADYTTDETEWKTFRRLWTPPSTEFMPKPAQGLESAIEPIKEFEDALKMP